MHPSLWALSICLEKPVVPVGNQMERAFPLEIFRKKRNTVKGIPLFSKILTGFSKQMESAPCDSNSVKIKTTIF